MRAIKFRAWDKIKNEIFVPTRINLWLLNQLSKYSDGSGTIASNDCVLMQYTGLHDKNGVEIYEGDIVKGRHFIGFIESEENIVEFVLNMQNGDYESLSWLKGYSNFEVIGNIYEHSYLLDNKDSK